MRKRLGKGAVASEPARILRRALDPGLVLRASIGLGWPEESADEMAETIRRAESLTVGTFSTWTTGDPSTAGNWHPVRSPSGIHSGFLTR